MNSRTGDRIFDIARRHVGERYVLGAFVPKDNSNWHGPWDCAEFASWALFQSASILYGCQNNNSNPATADAYTGYWERDARSLGHMISIDQAARTLGAMVLRFPQTGATGHIVISDGRGGTVEAHSSTDGVITSTLANRRWDTGVLVPGITYNQGPAVPSTPPAGIVYRLTIPAMSGSKVLEIQQALRTAGFDPGSLDGEFGPHTHAAVLAFQLAHGLLADGEVGPRTASALGIKL
jgi:hypothetical protein